MFGGIQDHSKTCFLIALRTNISSFTTPTSSTHSFNIVALIGKGILGKLWLHPDKVFEMQGLLIYCSYSVFWIGYVILFMVY